MKKLHAISDAEDKHCKKCAIRLEIQKKFQLYIASQFCRDVCPIGKGIASLGREIEFDVPIRTGLQFSQDDYEELAKRYADKDICKRVGISQTTLSRRKKTWGLTRVNPTKDFTQEEYDELKLMRYSDEDVAKIKGFSSRALKEWKTKHKIKAPSILTELIITKEKKDYLKALGEGMTEQDIAESWNISTRTLRRWKSEKGVRY